MVKRPPTGISDYLKQPSLTILDSLTLSRDPLHDMSIIISGTLRAASRV